MSAPQPASPPLTANHVCAAWAQVGELPIDSQDVLPEGLWCDILAYASDILWAVSGRRWRNIAASETVTLDPVDVGAEAGPWPLSGTATGYGLWGSKQPWQWSQARPHQIRLPRPDVTAVTAVVLDTGPFTAWRLAGSWLYRTDRRGWPLATTTVITYTYGRLVPAGGRLACLALADELGKAFAGKACALPSRVTNVTRQGISFAALESLAVLKEGLIGVHSVDVWLAGVNPKKMTQSAQVWSPDTTLITARRV